MPSIWRFIPPVVSASPTPKKSKRTLIRQFVHHVFGTLRIVNVRLLDGGVPVVHVVCPDKKARVLRLDQSYFVTDIRSLREAVLSDQQCAPRHSLDRLSGSIVARRTDVCEREQEIVERHDQEVAA